MASQMEHTSEVLPTKAVGISQAVADNADRETPSAVPMINDAIRVLSWNISGRNNMNLAERSTAVYETIFKEAPDIVFLQELVPDGWRAIKEASAAAAAAPTELSVNDGGSVAKPAPRYGAVLGLRHYPYKCAVLLRLDVCELIGRKTIPFSTSAMGRNLLLVRARVRGIDFTLLTTHLESLDVMTEERQLQLRHTMMTVMEAPASQCVLLGGDLNVRDWELAAVGGIPAGAVDVWRAVYGDRHPDYTCDTVINDNGSDRAWTTCCRFDRFVFRPPTITGDAVVQPTLYRTVGRQRITSCGRFPSNHLGILAQFTVNNAFESRITMASQVSSTSGVLPAKAVGMLPATDIADHKAPLFSAPIINDNVIRVLSWNIDGLDNQNLAERSVAVYQVISNEAPDVVFLQELVPIGWRFMKEAAVSSLFSANHRGSTEQPVPRYGVVLGLQDCRYICAVMLRLDVCELIGRKTLPFPTSTMGRNLLLVRARVRGIDFTLLTTHLESLGVMTEKRRLQLRLSLMTVKDAPDSTCALLGGDLNLRDWELARVGGIPAGAVDVWLATGSDGNHEYTWDTEQNDNGGKREWTARLRFDRFIFRPPKTPHSASVQPILFRTVGRERIASCDRFPSDHWGILADFSVQNGSPAPQVLGPLPLADSKNRTAQEKVLVRVRERLQ